VARPQTNIGKAAAVGAVVGVALVVLNRTLGNTPANINSIPFWFGVAIAGAFIGTSYAAFQNRRR
jgi:drug/metabolite transporter (DMT)-like permease